ncbi:YlqD family protein [Desulfitobacterium chlororespirans]|uniref:YlqD protein n=1 Tax=Desulfitobacterium chlororespirans DSM 11544 TaxID=1121395 RepID=A0A1M7RVJ2_9FIRM|nr:YlqD family protein [Desulfitobacterium chlororespirans]SHN50184.1 YlqD protein [Desulfitobacterium chlororespirans DSM 11544]
MQSIPIFREITLKQIVTEGSKMKIRQQLNDQLTDLERELAEMEENKNRTLTEFSLKGAEEAHLQQIRRQWEMTRAQYLTQRDQIRMEMVTADGLKIGEEISIGSIEGPYELMIGEPLAQAMHAEIVLKDGIVVEIR